MSLSKNLLGLAGLAVFASAFSAQAADLKATGFGSFYYAQQFSQDVYPYGFHSKAADYTHFSLLGTDLSAKLSDEWSAAAEIVAAGTEKPISNFGLFTEWAYVNYTPVKNVSIKLGRQRFPVFTASEFLDTHFHLPYREVPAIVYKAIPFASFDGASVNHTIDVGFGNFSYGVFGGNPVLDYQLPATSAITIGSEQSDLIGGKISLDGEGWRVRLQASSYNSRITYSISNGALNYAFAGTASIYSAGYRFDKYDFVSWGEYAVESANNGSDVPAVPGVFGDGGKFLKKADTGYVLVGYRLGKYMPRYTYARTNQDIGIVKGSTTDNVVGLNYQAADNVTVKFDYEWLTLAGPGNGAIASNTDRVNPAGTSTNAIYLGADFTF